MSDAELVARARSGDRATFDELVARHQDAAYRTALAALGSPADAEDVAQESFCAAFQELGKFREASSFKTWLLAITWHRAIHRRRSANDTDRPPAAIQPLPPLTPLTINHLTPAEVTADHVDVEPLAIQPLDTRGELRPAGQSD